MGGRPPDSQQVFVEGAFALPVLPPGTTWSGILEWAVPGADYRLTLRLLRPTGFAVLEHIYNVHGRQE